MNMKKRIETLSELADRKLGANSLKLFEIKYGETREDAITRLGLTEENQDRFLLLSETDVKL